MDVVATSEVSISLTLDPSKIWSRELIQQASIWSVWFTATSFKIPESLNINLNGTLPDSVVGFPWVGLPSFLIPNLFICLMQELDHLVEELEKIAVVNLLQRRSIISLIGNVQRSSLILEKVSFSSRLSLVLYRRNFLIKWTFLTRLHSYTRHSMSFEISELTCRWSPRVHRRYLVAHWQHISSVLFSHLPRVR